MEIPVSRDSTSAPRFGTIVQSRYIQELFSLTLTFSCRLASPLWSSLVVTCAIRRQVLLRMERCQRDLLSLTSLNHWSQSWPGWEARSATLKNVRNCCITGDHQTSAWIKWSKSASCMWVVWNKTAEGSPQKTHINCFFVQVADCCGGNERQGGGSFKCRDSPTFERSSPGKEAFFSLMKMKSFCSALEVDHATAVHSLDGQGKQSQRVLPRLRRAVRLQRQLQHHQRHPEVGSRQSGVEAGRPPGHQEGHPCCCCCAPRCLCSILYKLD